MTDKSIKMGLIEKGTPKYFMLTFRHNAVFCRLFYFAYNGDPAALKKSGAIISPSAG